MPSSRGWSLRRYRLRDATTVGWLGITLAEARALGLRHLCPLELKRARRRRAAGAVPRPASEAGSAARAWPWQAAGISRATWYRRRAALARAAVAREDAAGGVPPAVRGRQPAADPRLVEDC